MRDPRRCAIATVDVDADAMGDRRLLEKPVFRSCLGILGLYGGRRTKERRSDEDVP
jgi:hypothetical protein